jgi:hypothetical protein
MREDATCSFLDGMYKEHIGPPSSNRLTQVRIALDSSMTSVIVISCYVSVIKTTKMTITQLEISANICG